MSPLALLSQFGYKTINQEFRQASMLGLSNIMLMILEESSLSLDEVESTELSYFLNPI